MRTEFSTRMLTYFLIGLALVLTGVAGLQFSFLFYADRMDLERKKYLRELERRSEDLARRLKVAEAHIKEQDSLIERFSPLAVTDSEAWADVIDEN